MMKTMRTTMMKTSATCGRPRRIALVALLALLVAGLPRLSAPPTLVHADVSTVINETICTEAQILADLNIAPTVDIQLDCTPAQGQTGVIIPFTTALGIGPSTDAAILTPTVAQSVTIEMAPTAPATVTLDGGQTSSIFQLDDAALTLRHLTVANGRRAVFISTGNNNGPGGTLTVDASTFATNVGADGAAIVSIYGVVNVNASTFTGNSAHAGAAIYNSGMSALTVNASTFTGNTAVIKGGALYSQSMIPMTVTNSTFVGNSADGSLGGGAIATSGGGTSVGYGALFITNSTFVGNHADGSSSVGGAIYVAASGGAAIRASTVSGNHANNGGQGGGLYNGATAAVISLASSIIAGNSADIGPDMAGFNGGTFGVGSSFGDGGYNVIGNNLSPDSAASAGLLVNPDGSPLLMNNGGSTATVALDLSLTRVNPAIGIAGCLTTTDQRGYARPGTGKLRCDSGAFESSSVPLQSAVTAQQATDAATALVAQQTAVAAQQTTDAATGLTNQQTAVAAQQAADAATARAAQQTAVTAQQTADAATALAATPTAGVPTAASTATSTPAATNTASTTPAASTATSTATATNIATATNTPPATPTSTPLSATLALSPTMVSPYQTLTLSGVGFGSSEVVRIFWDSASTTALITPSTTSAGAFSATLTVPQSIAGAHTLIAVGQSSQRTANAPLQIKPALSLSPASGRAGSLVYLTGIGFGRGETVAVSWYPGGKLLSTGASSALGTVTMTFIVPLSTTGSYNVVGYGVTSKQVAMGRFTLTALAHAHLVFDPAHPGTATRRWASCATATC